MDSWHEAASYAVTQKAYETKLVEIENILSKATEFEPNTLNSIICIGKTVVLSNTNNNQLTFTIVHSLEANPAHRKISTLSNIGKKLNSKKIGDEILIGNIKYRITDIT